MPSEESSLKNAFCCIIRVTDGRFQRERGNNLLEITMLKTTNDFHTREKKRITLKDEQHRMICLCNSVRSIDANTFFWLEREMMLYPQCLFTFCCCLDKEISTNPGESPSNSRSKSNVPNNAFFLVY